MASSTYIEQDFGEILFSVSQQVNDEEEWIYESDDEILDALYNDSATPSTDIELQDSPNNVKGAHSIVLDPVDTLYSQCDSSTVIRKRRRVIEMIEKIFEDIVDALSDEGCDGISITLQSRSRPRRRQPSQPELLGTTPPRRTQEISYPGNSNQEAWRFTVVVRILELIHGCLIDCTVMTKRDLYYRHPDLFGKQSVVDQYVDDIACTFGVPRALLNVTATAKGLLAGNFAIRRKNGGVVHGLGEQEGILVPQFNDDDTLEVPSVRWVLVIEKEATFRSLLSSVQWKTLRTQGLVLTAKGYPDLASRKFLRLLSDKSPGVSMFALVDYDPDGIAILSTYKYGSYRLAHEDVAYTGAPGLRLPDLQWLGVQSHHMSRTPIDEGGTAMDVLSDLQGLMKLTLRDRKKAQQMLGWDICGEEGPETGWRAELQRMLMLNIKAELQILDELPGGLVGCLSKELAGRAGASGKAADDEILF